MIGKYRSGLGVLLVAALIVALVPVAAFAVDPLAIYYPPDAFESDDTAQQASVYDPDQEVTQHTLSDADDVDWVLFSAEETGQPFLIEAEPTGGRDIDLEMEIFAVDTLGASVDLPDLEGVNYNDDALWNTFGSQCFFTAPARGDYAVSVYSHDDSGNGAIGSYTLTVSDGIARRIFGADRYDTAAKVSQTIWPMTDLWGSYQNPVNANEPVDPECIIISNGLNWPDALAGSAFATAADGVLLLGRADSDMLPAVTVAEMERLLAAAYGYDSGSPDYYGMTVYILGGTSAIRQSTQDQIAAMDGVGEIVRLKGDSRYETAAEIGYEFADVNGLGMTATAFVVGGASPWDALAASPVAAFADAPVLLSMKSDVPTATLDFLADNAIQRVIVVGGASTLDAAAFAELDAAVGTVERVGGASRWETARMIAQWGVDNEGMSAGAVTLVSGYSFADGLAAAPISLYSGSPVLLTRSEYLVDEVYDFFGENGVPDAGSYVVGGPAAVSEDVFWEFKAGMWPYVVSLP